MEVPPTPTNLQASRGDEVRFTPDRRKSGGEEESRMTEDFFCEERESFFEVARK